MVKYYQEKYDKNSRVPARIYRSLPNARPSCYPLHWHTYLEFDLVLTGAVKGKINGKPFITGENDLVFVNSGDLHETDAVDSECISSITLLLSHELLEEYFPDQSQYFFNLATNAEAKAKVIPIIKKCADVNREKKRFYELELSILLREICLILVSECLETREVLSPASHETKNLLNTKRAIKYMEENYSRNITLVDISAEIGLAPTYFSRFFKQTAGETFYTYLMQIRLHHAHRDLTNTDKSIADVAADNGFLNVKSFIQAFKTVYKDTPAKYRKHAFQDKKE